MSDLVSALLLGIIEGITEFLPISSTGHLLIAEHWLGARSDLFNIAIQAGAILAVVAIYWRRLWDLLYGFLGRRSPASHDPARIALGPAQARAYALKLLLSFAVTAPDAARSNPGAVSDMREISSRRGTGSQAPSTVSAR